MISNLFAISAWVALIFGFGGTFLAPTLLPQQIYMLGILYAAGVGLYFKHQTKKERFQAQRRAAITSGLLTTTAEPIYHAPEEEGRVYTVRPGTRTLVPCRRNPDGSYTPEEA